MTETYFSKKLLAARTKAGKTQQQVADVLGIHHTNYVPFEKGRRFPSVKCRPALAEFLNIPFSQLEAWIIITQHGETNILAACQELKAG